MFKAFKALQIASQSAKSSFCLMRTNCHILSNRRGFTVTDLVIGIAVIGIVATIALPNLQPLMAKSRLNGAASQLLGDLMGARMKAVSQSRKVKVFFPDPHQYKVCDDANNDGSVDDCEGTAQIKDLQSSYAGVSVSATLNPLFSAKGSAANYTTITLTNTSGSKTITIEITGHVSIN